MDTLRANNEDNLLDLIKDWLDKDKRFYYLGRGNNKGVWSTRQTKESGTPIDLVKNMAGKGMADVTIYLFKEDEQGVEFKVQMVFPSYLSDDTVFEGFVNTFQEFGIIMKAIGLLQ